MACRTEPVGAANWRFCPDEIQAPGVRMRALVMARVIDEITGLPLARATVRALDPHAARHLAPRAAAGGVLGLAGRPAEVFPDLAGSAAPVPMAVAAAGYLPLRLDGTLGPIAGFPEVFAPLDHGDVAAHRRGVGLRGRVVRRGTPANTVLGGASVEIDGIWPTCPPPNVMPAAVMQPARMTAVFPGLYRDRAASVLERCDLADNPAETKTLLLPAPAGSTRLRLSNRRTLAAGMLLHIAPLDPDRRESVVIASVDTALSDDQAAWIELAYPLAWLHRPGSAVMPTAVTAVHDARSLARPGLAGDPIVFLGASAPWLDGSLVRVDDGVNPPEFHRHQRYATVADADGYFRLPPVSRLALFRLRATHPGPPAPLLTTISLDYGLAEQELQVAFE